MKYRGKRLEKPQKTCLVLPRQAGDIVLWFNPVLDFDAFLLLCPAPKPPVITKPGGGQITNLDDKKFLKDLDVHAAQRTSWMILKSLEGNEIEWETVDMLKPETYENFQKELIDTGFSQLELNRIIGGVIDACGLNSAKIDEATKSFLATALPVA